MGVPYIYIYITRHFLVVFVKKIIVRDILGKTESCVEGVAFEFEGVTFEGTYSYLFH